MKNINKGLLLILATTGLGIAKAGMYVPVNAPVPTPVVSPNNWAIGLDALYLQPNPVKNIALIERDNSDFTIADDEIQNVGSNWDWGFRFNVSYLLQDDSDINLIWTHFNSDSDPNIIHGDNVSAFIGTRYLPDPANAASWTTAESSVSDEFNQVDLEFAKTAKFAESSVIRFFAGLSYLDLEQNIGQVGTLDAVPVGTGLGQPIVASSTFSSSSSFNGIGPRAGTTYAYLLGHGFSLVGTAAASIYVGDVDYNANWENVNVNLNQDPDGAQALEADSDNRFVPGVELRLGLAYASSVLNGALLSIEGGYQVNHYWDGIENQDSNQNVLDQDFSFSGVYFGLNFVC